MTDSMKYWDNKDGTFTVVAYEVTYSDGTPTKTVYTHAIAYREWAWTGACVGMERKLLTRDHRPAVGTEVVKP